MLQMPAASRALFTWEAGEVSEGCELACGCFGPFRPLPDRLFDAYLCRKFHPVSEDFRKPTSKVAHNREEQEDYRISTGSSKFLTWLGVVLVIPGIVLLIWEAERNVPAGLGFIAVGLFTSWTGAGARRLFKNK